MLPLDGLIRDFRYALRTLRREPALSGFAILIVGLGIAASSIVFNVVHALLLRPLPFVQPEQLVWIANGESDNLSAQTAQVANLADLQEQTRTLAGVAAFSPFYTPGDIRFTGSGEAERLTGVPVTQNFFELLGVRMRIGRSFTPEEAVWNAPKVAVLSHAFWQRRFAGDAAVLGRVLTLDGAPATVVGVAPEGFDFAGTFTPGGRADLFLPFPLSPETNRQGNTLALIGRLREGSDLAAARAEASVIGDQIESARSADQRRNAFRPRLLPLRDRVSGTTRGSLALLAAAVGFLMLLVCADLSNLLLARAASRSRELAVRLALGADRRQLIRQMLVEALTLSVSGALFGLLLAAAGTRLVSQIETGVPLLHSVQWDGTALGFVVLAALATGVAFGVLPAVRASSADPHAALQDGSRGSSGGRGRMQSALVVAEVAAVCVLLTGAGLLARSLGQVLAVDLGFEPSNVIAVRVDPRRAGTTRATRNAYFDAVLENARAVPGSDAVGLTDALPLGDNFGWRRWTAAPPDWSRERRLTPLVRMIDEGYLPAMKVPLRAGRNFTTADTDASEPVVIVNQALAKIIWPEQDPIGQVLRTSNVDRRVVGVVAGVRYFALERDSGEEMYLPLRQTGDYQVVDLVVRSNAPDTLAPGLRAALQRVDPTLPVADVRTVTALVDRSLFARRSVMLTVAAFAAFGVILAALGLYAVISYSVSQRRHEIGIRLALGATPSVLQGSILAQTFSMALAGLAIGLPASWATARAIQGLLFEVPVTDGVTFAGVVVLLAIVAALAGFLPARRASRIDPAIALRC